MFNKKGNIMILICFGVILAGGIFMKHQNDVKLQNEQEIKLFETAKKRMTSFLKANYENISDITYREKYDIDPMGGISVEGYLNKDPKQEFWGIYNKSMDEIGGSSVEADKKADCEKEFCKY